MKKIIYLRILLTAVIVLICFLSPSIYAYDEERAITNLASDFAQCSAFYVISAEEIFI